MQDLGLLPGAGPLWDSYACEVSADGSVVVGFAEAQTTGHQAYRWTAATAMQPLEGLMPGELCDAYAVSADGLVQAGDSLALGLGVVACRWCGGVAQTPPALPGDTYAVASAVSGDGAVVVGTSERASGADAVRWTAAGVQSLGHFPGSTSGVAYDVSADASVIVGTDGNRAFRWTQATGLVDLGTLPGGTVSWAGGSAPMAWSWCAPATPARVRCRSRPCGTRSTACARSASV